MINGLSPGGLILNLSWLFPATLLLHLIEEYWGGTALSNSPDKMRGVNLAPAQFLALTGFGLALMIAGIILALRFGFPQLLLVILGIFVLINGLSHTLTSVLKAEYNPGVISGLLIWIPLGVVTLIGLKDSMTGHRYWMGTAIGIGIHAVVSTLARSWDKLFKA
jgi:hypothetical protein